LNLAGGELGGVLSPVLRQLNLRAMVPPLNYCTILFFPLEVLPIGHVSIKLRRMTSTSEGCIVPLELVIVLITSWNFLQWKSCCLDLGLGFRVFVIRDHVLMHDEH
jgi:hypothetical protein